MSTVSLLLRDCYTCVSFAMSCGFVSILLLWLAMLFSGGVSKFLNTFMFIFWGLVSYSFLYLDMTILMKSLVYLVVIFMACKFVVLANVAISLMHRLSSGRQGGGRGVYAYAAMTP